MSALPPRSTSCIFFPGMKREVNKTPKQNRIMSQTISFMEVVPVSPCDESNTEGFLGKGNSHMLSQSNLTQEGWLLNGMNGLGLRFRHF